MSINPYLFRHPMTNFAGRLSDIRAAGFLVPGLRLLAANENRRLIDSG
jgi:hypothetical protein